MEETERSSEGATADIWTRAGASAEAPALEELAEDLALAVECIEDCRFVGLRTANGWVGARDANLTRAVEPHLPRSWDDSLVPVAGLGTVVALRVGAAASGWLIVVVDAPDVEPAKLRVLRSIALTTRASRAGARATESPEQTAGLMAEARETIDARRLLRPVRDATRRLADSSSEGRGLRGIADVVYDLLGLPAAMWSGDGELLAEAPVGTAPQTPPAFSADDRVSYAAGWVYRTFKADTGPILTIAVRDSESRGDDADAVRAVILEQAASAAVLELYRRRSVTDAELRMWRELALELLFGTDEDRARAHADALGYNVASSNRVVLLEAALPLSRLAAIARATVSVLGGTPLVTRYGRHIAVIMPSDGDLTAFGDTIETEIGSHEWRAGVSPPADGLKLSDALREAEVALGIAQQLGTRGVTRFDDLGIYRLLLVGGDSAEMDAFVERWLGVLIDHDRRRKSQLVRTLSEYLEGGGSLDRAAAALSIHRSTLKYRLDRVASLLDVDLQSADVRFNLMLAIRIVTTERALRTD